jgi:AbrB family looped-hinge helix DNA binding protein
MAKVTSKLQVTIPKAIAEQYSIVPGDEIEFQPAGDVIRIIPARGRRSTRQRLSLEDRLRLFDEAERRQRLREKERNYTGPTPAKRDWKREDLYTRGKTR